MSNFDHNSTNPKGSKQPLVSPTGEPAVFAPATVIVPLTEAEVLQDRKDTFSRMTFFWMKRLYCRRAQPIAGCGERTLLVLFAPIIFIADLTVTLVWWVASAVAFLLLGLCYVLSCGFVCRKERFTWNVFVSWLVIVAAGVFGAMFGAGLGLLGVGCVVLLAYQGALSRRPKVVQVTPV
jgi:hypothetical protein